MVANAANGDSGGDTGPLLGGQSIDVALDVEQQIYAFDCLEGAIGEIGGAVFPRRVLAAMSASTKNLRSSPGPSAAPIAQPSCIL